MILKKNTCGYPGRINCIENCGGGHCVGLLAFFSRETWQQSFAVPPNFRLLNKSQVWKIAGA